MRAYLIGILVFLVILLGVVYNKYYSSDSCSNNVIHTAICPEYPDFCEIDKSAKEQTFKGREIVILEAAANLLGKGIKYKIVDFLTLVQMKEDIDVGIGCITVTDERAKSFDFSDSYKTVKLGYIHSKSKKMKQVKKIGFQIGSTIQTHIDKKYEVQGFHDVFTMFEKLKAGEIDAIAVEEVLFNQNLIDTKKFAFHDIKGAADKYAFAVKKGNTEVLNAINKAIKSTNGGKNPVKKVDAASAVPAPSNEEKKPSTDKTTKAE